MKNALFAFVAKLLGRNLNSTPASVILDQMNEKRSLPIGKPQFEEWSDRVLSGALLSADRDSQKFALADMLLHLGPTISHECDAWFINSLRKFAINQTAVEIRKELHDKAKERLAKEDAEKAAELAKVDNEASETLEKAKKLSLIGDKREELLN